jgi:hypothetical protein
VPATSKSSDVVSEPILTSSLFTTTSKQTGVILQDIARVYIAGATSPAAPII